jgi:hypothetical protein
MGLRPEIGRGNTGWYGSDPHDPATSIRGAAEFLAHANALFDNWDTAYAAYSGAIGVDRSTPAFRDPAAFGDVARFRWALSRLGYIESPMPRNGTALAWAYEALGAPYVWGGQSLAGFDCSGLVYWAYQQVGVTLPRGSADQWAATTRISAGELRPGDLVFFGADLFHVGLYAGNGMMLHSPREGMTVEIVSLSDAYWSAHLVGYGRVP